MTTIKKYKKKNGETAYMFQTYLGKNYETGKYVKTTRRGFKTKQEAKIALSRLAVQSRDLDFILESNKTFAEVSEMWLEQYKNTVKASTFTVQKVALKNTYSHYSVKSQLAKLRFLIAKNK